MNTMNISTLIRDAWQTTWRYRFLWILALFAGGAAGGTVGSGQLRLGHLPVGRPGGMGPVPPMTPMGRVDRFGADGERWRMMGTWATRTGQDLLQWASTHVALVVAAGIAVALLGLALVALWLIAQGAMAEATVELGSGQRSSLGRAWRAGTHFFWRYAGLWLSLAAVAIVAAAVVGGTLAVVAGAGAFTGSRVLTVALALLIALPLALAAIAVAVAANIVVAYAIRAIAAEDEGPWAALRSGIELLQANFWPSVLTWAVYLGLAIASGIGLAVVLGVAGAVLVGVGAALWALAGVGTALVAYAALGGIALLMLILLLGSIANTFFWNYWTLAYLRLRHPGGVAVPSAA